MQDSIRSLPAPETLPSASNGVGSAHLHFPGALLDLGRSRISAPEPASREGRLPRPRCTGPALVRTEMHHGELMLHVALRPVPGVAWFGPELEVALPIDGRSLLECGHQLRTPNLGPGVLGATIPCLAGWLW